MLGDESVETGDESVETGDESVERVCFYKKTQHQHIQVVTLSERYHVGFRLPWLFFR